MMGTKDNPGKFDCYENAEPDEPMFVLLARDRMAPQLVRDWADARVHGGEDRLKVEEAYYCAEAMDRWRREHRPERSEIMTGQNDVMPVASTTGIRAIAAERRRQVLAEHWDAEHDDMHTRGQLVLAAECYLMAAMVGRTAPLSAANLQVPAKWPWEAEWWKPSIEPKRNLARAGALIAAEIDRLHRADIKRSQQEDVEPPPPSVDVDLAWRRRDWPGAASSRAPEWFIRLYAEYLETDEGRRQYPGGGRLTDGTPVTPGAVGTDHAYCEHGVPTGYSCDVCERDADAESHEALVEAVADVLADVMEANVGAAGSSREPGRTGPGSQIFI